jgi:ubiquinone/menaquinone biosynthesis C-methylase UbiE
VSDPSLDAAVTGIREEYARRAVAPQCAGEYSFLNTTHSSLVFERERALLAALGRHLQVPLEEAEILDVGAGVGTSLALLAAYGSDATRLHGVDVVADRIERGRAQFPAFDLRVSDGYTLPFGDGSFDVVQQITMLSSVHDDVLRERIVAEMRRVLRPGGVLLSFDVTSIPVLPRVLNRLFSAGRRRPAVGADGHSGFEDAVRLTPVRPLGEPELRRLTAPLQCVEARRIGPYRPLVERSPELVQALMRAVPGFATTLLYVAR